MNNEQRQIARVIADDLETFLEHEDRTLDQEEARDWVRCIVFLMMAAAEFGASKLVVPSPVDEVDMDTAEESVEDLFEAYFKPVRKFGPSLICTIGYGAYVYAASSRGEIPPYDQIVDQGGASLRGIGSFDDIIQKGIDIVQNNTDEPSSVY